LDVVIEATPFPIAGSSLPKADPCVIVIFGALGDLATRKLVPALFRLAGAGCLSNRFELLGVAREQINDEEYRERMRAGAASSKEAGEIGDAEWRAFAGRLHYLQGDLTEVETYRRIARGLEQMTLQEGASENRLFYYRCGGLRLARSS
jgi:glucose-6-phosphate 1-dehydrogenase